MQTVRPGRSKLRNNMISCLFQCQIESAAFKAHCERVWKNHENFIHLSFLSKKGTIIYCSDNMIAFVQNSGKPEKIFEEGGKYG